MIFLSYNIIMLFHIIKWVKVTIFIKIPQLTNQMSSTKTNKRNIQKRIYGILAPIQGPQTTKNKGM